MWLRAAFAGYICARARACACAFMPLACALANISVLRALKSRTCLRSRSLGVRYRCGGSAGRFCACGWSYGQASIAPASVYIDERRWKVCTHTHTHTHKRSLISCARCGRCIMRLLASSEQCVYVKRRTWWIRSREASACRNHSETQNRKPYLLDRRRHERRRPAETGQN